MTRQGSETHYRNFANSQPPRTRRQPIALPELGSGIIRLNPVLSNNIEDHPLWPSDTATSPRLPMLTLESPLPWAIPVYASNGSVTVYDVLRAVREALCIVVT
ncbi:hypothetical protein B0H17DRAFT_1144762 [Mycena rosella]|uniref:DUF6699 domain-containing protein n=1 Tax=Mycena rosella TaxID=1033263 RepID=A0AAD7G6Q0_MYCRO|nr:hypothetical protein B0H17DRAFT_1144762 [Mycena rosella]